MTDMLTFEIDLNMLREDRVRSHVDFMQRAVSRVRPPEAGETVWAVDEDGAEYDAILEAVHESGFVDLRLELKTRRRFKLDPQVEPNFKDAFKVTNHTTTKTPARITYSLTPAP